MYELLDFSLYLFDYITSFEPFLFFLCFMLIGIGIGVLRKIFNSLR